MEEIEGFRDTSDSNDAVLENALEEFELMMKKKLYVTPKDEKKKLETLKEESNGDDESDQTETETDETDETECGSDNEDTDVENDQAKKNYELVKLASRKDIDDRLDCESIISTYSTIYNHPSTISEKKPIQLSKKSGLPLG